MIISGAELEKYFGKHGGGERQLASVHDLFQFGNKVVQPEIPLDGFHAHAVALAHALQGELARPAQPRDATRAVKEEVVYLNLSDLHPFKDHPFGVRDDAEMQGLVESVRSGGVNHHGGAFQVLPGAAPTPAWCTR